MARRIARRLNRPYYIYNPSQFLRRIRSTTPVGEAPFLTYTAWGAPISCFPDMVGNAIRRNGVYDIATAETLFRLVEPGETVVDAGANVGFMTAILQRATGRRGRVESFEPHPLVWEVLARNIAKWRDGAAIEAQQAAVSSRAGTLKLGVDSNFNSNKGTASFELGDAAETVDVATVRLTDAVETPIGVLKLDVEGHELAALQGAEDLLARHAIRDIVFEEHTEPPTPVTELLRGAGYTIIGVVQALRGPKAMEPRAVGGQKLWDPPTLLATVQPDRARHRLERRGWLCLRAKPRA